MKKCLLVLLRILEVLVVLIALSVFIASRLSKPDDLKFGIQRIQYSVGYNIDPTNAALILHKTNNCDSVVMIKDYRSASFIQQQMMRLVEADERWNVVQVSEGNVYNTIVSLMGTSQQTNLHFRPICMIDGGNYDYMFVDKSEYGDAKMCLIDIETGIVVLYIYLY